MLGISLLAYGDIERGKKDVAFSRLEQIADKLGVSVEDILSYGDRVSNFFDQCNNTNVNANNGKQRDYINNFDNRELQHKIEKLELTIEKLKLEKEKAEIEAKYWKEKSEKQ
jgi:transcriptional regulator with XRE-family HTH domain